MNVQEIDSQPSASDIFDIYGLDDNNLYFPTWTTETNERGVLEQLTAL